MSRLFYDSRDFEPGGAFDQTPWTPRINDSRTHAPLTVVIPALSTVGRPLSGDEVREALREALPVRRSSVSAYRPLFGEQRERYEQFLAMREEGRA